VLVRNVTYLTARSTARSQFFEVVTLAEEALMKDAIDVVCQRFVAGRTAETLWVECSRKGGGEEVSGVGA